MTVLEEDALITVVTYLDVVETAILESRVDEKRIGSYLMDANMSDVAWHLALSGGGSKVQVKLSDAKQAMKITETEPNLEHSEDAVWQEPSYRSTLLDEKVRAVMLGMIFFPLQIYSLWLFVLALCRKGNETIFAKCALVLLVNSQTIVSTGILCAAFPGAFDYSYSTHTFEGLESFCWIAFPSEPVATVRAPQPTLRIRFWFPH